MYQHYLQTLEVPKAATDCCCCDHTDAAALLTTRPQCLNTPEAIRKIDSIHVQILDVYCIGTSI